MIEQLSKQIEQASKQVAEFQQKYNIRLRDEPGAAVQGVKSKGVVV